MSDSVPRLTSYSETSAARGAAIFLDISRQHNEISHIEPLPKETNIVLKIQSVLDGLNERINVVLGTETEGLSEKDAMALERKAYFLLREHLERFAWEPLLLRLFSYIHALNISLKKEDASTDLRRQFDEVFRMNNVLEESVQKRDLAFWFYETGTNPELLAFLTDTGSSIDAVASYDGESGVRPIHVAAKHRQVAIMKWLLDNGAKIDAKTNQGSTCLHWALRGPFGGYNDDTAVLETLLAYIMSYYPDNKSLLNAEDANGCTALDNALGSGLEAECLLLRNAGAEENSKVKELRHAIVSAIEQENQKFVQDAIQKSPDLCHEIQLSGGTNILQLAVRRRSFNCAHIILQECEDPSALTNAQDVGGWSALHFAVFLEDLATSALLLDYGADIEVSTGEGYGSITFKRNVDGNRVILSVDYSKPLSAKKRGRWKPLHITAMMGNEPISQLLLDSGAHLHFKDLEGYTPIRRAISKGHEEVVEIILRHYIQQRNITDASPEFTGTPGISDAVYPPATRPVPAGDWGPRRTEAIQGALGDAVKIGNEKIVELLLSTGVDVDERSPQSGWTPLSHAIAQEDESLAAILLRNRADPRIIHSDGSTLLHLAAEGKDVRLVQMLLPYCPVNVNDNHGTTPLHRAAKKGYSPIAKTLLKNGAEINSLDDEERTALYIAVENVNLPVAQFLLDSGASLQRVGGSQKTLLHAAVYSGNSWALKFAMSQKGIQNAALDVVDDNGDTFLDTAAKGGHAKLLGELLRLFKPHNLWRPVLRTFFAMAESGNVDMLKVIIQHDKKFLSAFGAVTGTVRIASVGGIGAVSKSSWTALHAASWHGQSSAVEVLLASGASLATEAAGLTPLGLVCVTPQEQFCHDHLKVCELLVSKGASLAKGGLGHTTLHLAAISGHADLLELLLSHGAATSAVNEQGYSALQCAVESGNTMAVSILVERGYQTDSSSLHLAVHSGRLEIAQLLTSKGVQVNFVGKDGFTPLMVAAAIGHVAMLEHLLENGADLSLRTTDKGHSPLDMAVISHQLGSVIAIFNSPSYSAKFRTDRSYAWTAAGKDTSSESKIWKHIYERTECHRDHGAAILHWAVANSNEQLLDLVMQSGIDLKLPNSDGWSALHAAAMAGNTGMLKAILAKGIEIDYQGHSLRTALHQAVVANQPVAVTFLLQNGANPKILDEDSQGCVPIAIDHGAIDAIKALNLRAEDFTTNIFNGKTPVALAAQSDDNAMLRALLTIERSLGSRHRSSLHQVVGAGDAQLVQKVLLSGAEINRQDLEGRSPLRLAVMQQNVSLTTLLLQAGADVESRCNLGVTALSYAAKINDIAIAELLIRHGADVNATETQNKCPMLISAAWRGHLDMVKLLIKSGCNIQCRTASGSTALHEATLKTQKEIISELVRAGLSVNTKDGNGSTALYLTSQYRLDATTAEVLLTLGADMETKSKIGYTTLLNAVLANQYDLAKALVDHGADINHPDDSGRTPIMAAASTDAMACFLLLKQHGARMDMVNDEGQSLLHFAATSGSVAIARDLLEEGFDVNFEVINKRLTPLHVAATEGHLDFVRYLIEEGADAGVKSSDGNTALTLACRGKNESHAEIARYIIDLGHINEGISEGSGATLLTTAVQEGNMAVVKILIAKGAKLDDAQVRGKSILHLAATSGNVALFEFLLRQGISLSGCIDGIDGESVLFKAAAKGHAEMVSAIAERAPELADKADAKGITPVQRAVLKQHLSVVKVLCERGVNMKQRRGTSAETLLHLAATVGSEPNVKDLIRCLLDQGLSIYEVSYDGYTPLRKAAAHGCVEAATALLDYGAAIDDVGFAQSSGRALDIAVAKGHADMVQLLVTRGASLTFTDERGKLILDAAVAANNADVVKNILNGEGANSYINAVARDNGLGLVHMATLNNNGSIVTLLLQHGAYTSKQT
jgi:ankyrin repeat protein